jgi:flagellar basal body rod protein FlgG
MWTDFEQGKLRRTGGMFGVAISGKGFFAVQTPDGVQYTCNGTFARRNQGVLVNMLGQPVLDVGRAYRCTTFSQPLIDANGIIKGRDELLGIDKVLGVVR